MEVFLKTRGGNDTPVRQKCALHIIVIANGSYSYFFTALKTFALESKV